MTAIFYGSNEAAEVLLGRGARTDVRGEDGASARSIAVWRGNTALLAKLPQEPPRPPNAADLIAAVIDWDHAAVAAYLAAGVDPKSADARGTPVLALAAASGDSESIKALLGAGVPADIVGPDDVTALMLAVQQKHTEAVNLLLEAGADPTKHGAKIPSAIAVAEAMGADQIATLLRAHAKGKLDDEGSIAALAEAARNDDVKRAAQLLADGVSPDGGLVHGKRVVPLIVASFAGAQHAVAALLDKGASVNQADDNGTTPVMAAIAGKSKALADLLASHQADLSATNKAGLSASDLARAVGWDTLGEVSLFKESDFLAAVKAGDLKNARKFIGERDDKSLRDGLWALIADDRGWRPLQYAAQSGNAELVAWLLRLASADQNDNGTPSALMIAAANGKLDAVNVLLSSGADPLRADGAGRTAGDMAAGKNFAAVAKVLRAAEKSMALKLTSGLAQFGYLPRQQDKWDAEARKAAIKMFNEFNMTYSGNTPSGSDTLELINKWLPKTTRVCNQLGQKAYVAYIFNPDASDYPKVNAWFSIERGACHWAKAGDDLSLMIYAETGQTTWGAKQFICLPDPNRRIDGEIMEVGPDCPKGTKKAGFWRYDPGSSQNPIILK
jgi:ankyrin repeat protein